MRPWRRLLPWIAGVLSLLGASVAHADGEVGLVIEENGQVRTFCIAYSGGSISGDDLLAAAGVPYEDLGTSAGSVLCSIENTGCFDAGSYDECWCKCTGSGGGNCTYWAFFTRDYAASWVYSARAFDRTSSNDGDVHAWRWGLGSASSAPRPSNSLTFESICGHAPGGGLASPTAAPTLAATPNQPSPPRATSQPGSSPLPATESPATTGTRTSSLTPEVSVTFTASATREQVTPLPPRTADRPSGSDGGGGPGALIAFGVVAGVLVAGIGSAAYWRRSRGS